MNGRVLRMKLCCGSMVSFFYLFASHGIPSSLPVEVKMMEGGSIYRTANFRDPHDRSTTRRLYRTMPASNTSAELL